MENNYLYHYGVLGMKWGVRRARRQPSTDSSEAKALKKKKVSELSNAELRKLNDRMNLERNYSQLNPSAIKKGAKMVATAAIATTTILNLYNNSNKLIGIGKSVVGKLAKK